MEWRSPLEGFLTPEAVSTRGASPLSSGPRWAGESAPLSSGTTASSSSSGGRAPSPAEALFDAMFSGRDYDETLLRHVMELSMQDGHRGAPPASRCALGKLDRVGVLDADAHASVLARPCAICHEEFCAGGKAVRLPQCGHAYHEPCIRPWLEIHNTCPECREPLPDDGGDGSAAAGPAAGGATPAGAAGRREGDAAPDWNAWLLELWETWSQAHGNALGDGGGGGGGIDPRRPLGRGGARGGGRRGSPALSLSSGPSSGGSSLGRRTPPNGNSAVDEGFTVFCDASSPPRPSGPPPGVPSASAAGSLGEGRDGRILPSPEAENIYMDADDEEAAQVSAAIAASLAQQGSEARRAEQARKRAEAARESGRAELGIRPPRFGGGRSASPRLGLGAPLGSLSGPLSLRLEKDTERVGGARVRDPETAALLRSLPIGELRMMVDQAGGDSSTAGDNKRELVDLYLAKAIPRGMPPARSPEEAQRRIDAISREKSPRAVVSPTGDVGMPSLDSRPSTPANQAPLPGGGLFP